MKVSFFSSCMNRTEHLKQTLLKNLQDNSDYENFEYVVLNYNSQDDLEEWIKDNFMEYIQNGRLVYFREKSAVHYSFSHADNIAARLCSGDIICNVMADNFTGKGFASYVYRALRDTQYALIRCTEACPSAGRICMRKRHFLQLGGYDETLEGWGAQDGNLAFRAMAYGLKLIPMEKRYYSFIDHPHELSLRNLKVKEEKLFFNLRLTTIRIAQGDILANTANGFGMAAVYKNFHEDEAIVLGNKRWKPKWQYFMSRLNRRLMSRPLTFNGLREFLKTTSKAS